MSAIAETARIVTDLVYGFQGLMVVGTGAYFISRRRRILTGSHLDLSLNPTFAHSSDEDDALVHLLEEVNKWCPSNIGCVYVLDSERNELRLVVADRQRTAEIYDGTALEAPPLASPPLSLTAWQGTVEARVVRGRELRGSTDAWLELPFSEGRLVVRLLGNRAAMPNRPILTKMTEACRAASPMVDSCLHWRKALVEREASLAMLGSRTEASVDDSAESVAAVLALGRSLTGARDACFVVHEDAGLHAIALGEIAGAYAREVAAGSLPRAEAPVVEVSIGGAADAPDRIVFFDTEPVQEGSPRMQWVRNLGGYARKLLTERSVQDIDNDAYIESIRALVSEEEQRNAHVAGHDQRVARYARWIAEGIGLPPKEVDAVALGAFLHDVGMSYTVPELASVDGLIEHELYDRMTQHAEVGALLVERVQADVPIAPMVLGHHERWDGGGYPLGLHGNEIPLGARIIAVADHFDALTTSRTYRPALRYPEATTRLADLSGASLDPDLVEALLRAWTARGERAVEGLPILRCWELKQLGGHICAACPNHIEQVVRCWESPENLCTRHGDQCETCIVFTHAIRTGLASPSTTQGKGVHLDA